MWATAMERSLKTTGVLAVGSYLAIVSPPALAAAVVAVTFVLVLRSLSRELARRHHEELVRRLRR